MSLGSGVFERSGRDSLSANMFYLTMGLMLVYGLGGTALVAHLVAAANYVPGTAAIIVLGFVIPIIGVIISIKSDNALVSFIGYNMIAMPFGVILAPVLNHYQPDVIERAFAITCGVTFMMMMAGAMFPQVFANIGGALFAALLGLLVMRIMQMFIPALAGATWIDWLAAAIFSLYVGFDFGRASEVPKTLDNAVDVAVSLYLDVINLFLSILRILGNDD